MRTVEVASEGGALGGSWDGRTEAGEPVPGGVYFVLPRGPQENMIGYRDFQGGAPRAVARIPAGEVAGIAVSPDSTTAYVAVMGSRDIAVVDLSEGSVDWLRGVGANIRLGRLAELYFVGNFFNMFLLSGFGGDVVRILEAARNVPGNIATGTVLLDRFTC